MTRSFEPKATQFAATPENLGPARSFLRNYMAEAKWGGRDLDVVIAVGEILQNVVRHGFSGGRQDGTVKMLAMVKDDDLIVIVEDTAPPSMPGEWSNEGREAHEGGLGLGIVKRIASSVEFKPTATGNRAKLIFTSD